MDPDASKISGTQPSKEGSEAAQEGKAETRAWG